MATAGAAGFPKRTRSPALMTFSDDDEGGGPVFSPAASPAAETGNQPPSPRPDGQFADEQTSPAPLPRCTLRTTPPKVNSVRVPFDPDDQSDDEVIISSVYEKKIALATSSSTDDNEKGKPAGSSARTRGRGNHEKAASSPLNPCASPFKTTAAAAKRPEKPLVTISELPPVNLEPGSVYPGNRVKFCPWSKVVSYHTQYVGKANSVRVAPYFALSELLQAQDWHLCYLWHPAKDKQSTYVLVVPTEQVVLFLNRINETLDIHLAIPAGDQGEGFWVAFGSHKSPVPRFLGHARSPAALEALLKDIPARHPDDEITSPVAEAYYLKKVSDLLRRPGKSEQKKAKAEKARIKRFKDHKRWGHQAKRIQRYLGLRKTVATGDDGASLVASPPPGGLDLTEPAPFDLEGDVLFVAMDIESYEHHQRMLTEIGFAVLDTRDVEGVAPGPKGEGWHELIQARHIRILENMHMVNRHYLQGAENNFNFGTSEVVRLREALALVTQMLQPKDDDHEPRKVILVGHDIQSDIKLVKNIGFHVKDGMFLEVVDTQELHQHFRHSNQNAGLRTVLVDLQLEHMFLHNAGNDAVYTLQAMVTLAIAKRQESLCKQNERQAASYKPNPETIKEGWDTGGELSDGGLPQDDVGPVDEPPVKSPRTPSRRSKTRGATSSSASRSSKAVDPWDQAVSPSPTKSTSTWPPPVNELDDLIDL